MNRNLTRRNNDLSPWSMLKGDVWDLFDNFEDRLSEQFTPKIEIKDLDKSYVIKAEVPGMAENDINVSLKNNQLIIEGEKKNESKSEDKEKGTYHSEFSYGRFYRAIPFSDDVDTENITASCNNGVLNIELAKKPERMSKERKIEISSGGRGDKKVESKH